MKVEKFEKAFAKLSDDDKKVVLAKLGISDETEEVETNENEATKETENVDLEKKDTSPKEEKQSETTTENVVENKEEATQETTPEVPTQGEVTGYANGDTIINVDDIATKDFVKEFIASEIAKYKSLEDENLKLKEKLDDMSNKYEKQDFGNETQKMGDMGNNSGNSDYVSFDEYSKKFM